MKGPAESVLEGKYGLRGNGMFLSNLIRHNIKRRELPDTNLHMFIYDYFQDGQTPYLPILKQLSDESVCN